MIQVTTEGSIFFVKIPWELSPRAKLVPAYKWNASAKRWVYPANPVSAWNLWQEFQVDVIEGDDSFNEHFQTFKKLRKIKKDPPNGFNFQIKTKMWGHQIIGAVFAVTGERVLFDMRMGTGKSLTGIAAANYISAKAILILCPKTVMNVWPNQFAIHSSKEYEIIFLDQKGVQKKKDFLHVKSLRLQIGKIPHVVIVNYDSACLEPLADYLSEYPFDVCFLDESHRIKSPKTNISKYVFRKLQNITNIYAMTGTPMGNSPTDIFGQYRALNTSVYGVYFNAFRDKFVRMGGYGNYQEIGFKNEAEFKARFETISYTVEKSKDLPEEVEQIIEFDLSPKARKIYETMEKEFIVEVEAGTVTAANAMVKLIRLQQITSGFVVTEDDKNEFVDTSKKDLLKDILLDVTLPVIVFCLFKIDLEQIREVSKSLGLRHGEISGRHNDLTSDAKLPDNIDLMAVQMQSGGLGIDLSRASTSFFYSLQISRINWEQCRSRLHRQGQMNKVNSIYLIAKKSVDGKILKALKKMGKVIEELIYDYKQN